MLLCSVTIHKNIAYLEKNSSFQEYVSIPCRVGARSELIQGHSTERRRDMSPESEQIRERSLL